MRFPIGTIVCFQHEMNADMPALICSPPAGEDRGTDTLFVKYVDENRYFWIERRNVFPYHPDFLPHLAVNKDHIMFARQKGAFLKANEIYSSKTISSSTPTGRSSAHIDLTSLEVPCTTKRNPQGQIRPTCGADRSFAIKEHWNSSKNASSSGVMRAATNVNGHFHDEQHAAGNVCSICSEAGTETECRSVPGDSHVRPAAASLAGVINREDDGKPEPSKIPQVRKSWTVEEIDLLYKLMRKAGSNPVWNDIAKHFPNRSSRDVARRWNRCQDPQLRKGPWSRAEDYQLLCGVQKSKKFVEIGKGIYRSGHRTNGRYTTKYLPRIQAMGKTADKIDEEDIERLLNSVHR